MTNTASAPDSHRLVIKSTCSETSSSSYLFHILFWLIIPQDSVHCKYDHSFFGFSAVGFFRFLHTENLPHFHIHCVGLKSVYTVVILQYRPFCVTGMVKLFILLLYYNWISLRDSGLPRHRGKKAGCRGIRHEQVSISGLLTDTVE